MSELHRLVLKDGCRAHCDSLIDELRRLEALNGELLDALKLVFPTLERLKFEADGSYGNNFSQARADTARKNYQAARAAIEAALKELNHHD